MQTTDSTNGWLYNPIPRIISNNYAKEYEQIDTLCLSYILNVSLNYECCLF